MSVDHIENGCKICVTHEKYNLISFFDKNISEVVRTFSFFFFLIGLAQL